MLIGSVRRRRGRLLLVASVATSFAVVSTSALAATRGPARTLRVSVNQAGGGAFVGSFDPAISADGRYVAFHSEASSFVSGDTNQASDVFVRDMVTGTTVRASVDSAGVEGGADSYNPSISADGRYVAFESDSDLAHGDGHNTDIFVRDLVTGTTTLVTADFEGGPSNGPSWDAAISADGTHVAFESYADDLVPEDSPAPCCDLFVRDMVAGLTTRASVDRGGGNPNQESCGASISADGRLVAFASLATDLLPDGGGWDAYVRDAEAGTTVRVSADLDGGPSNGFIDLEGPSISADGRYVAFSTFATDLVEGISCSDRCYHVYLRDLLTSTTTLVSVDVDGNPGDDDSSSASISADGRYVAFVSWASRLTTDADARFADIFVRDMVTGTTRKVNVDTTGGPANHNSDLPAVSATGRYIAFQSFASDLVRDDGNETHDVFVRNMVAPPRAAPAEVQVLEPSGRP